MGHGSHVYNSHNYHSTTISIEDKEGAVCLEELDPDESVIAPGLIYRAERRS